MFNNFGRLFFSLFAGIFSGLVALLLLSIVQSLFGIFSGEEFISIFFINEIVEELIKLLSIVFIFNLLITEQKDQNQGFFYAFLIGIGFGLFELALIIISNNAFSVSSILAIIGIHSITSLILGIALVFGKFKNLWFFSVFLIISAVLIHIVYNLLALNI